MANQDVSGMNPIETFLGSMFSPQYVQRLMNRDPSDHRNYRNLLNPDPRSPGVLRDDMSVFMNIFGRNIQNPMRMRVYPRNIRANAPFVAFNTIINHWNRGAQGIEEVLQNSFTDTGGVLKKASSAFIESLSPPEKIEEGSMCGICQDDLCENDRMGLLELPCKHVYNKECILEWFKKSNTCPICRKEFDCEEVSVGTSPVDLTDHDGVQDDEDDGMENEGGVESARVTESVWSTGGVREDIRSLNRGFHIANAMIDAIQGALDEMPVPRAPRAQGSRDSTIDEDTILQEMILRSLRES